MVPEEKYVEITMKFLMPIHKCELADAMNGAKYSQVLHEIYETCRAVWKYEENPSQDKVEFAEKIAQMATDSGYEESYY